MTERERIFVLVANRFKTDKWSKWNNKHKTFKRSNINQTYFLRDDANAFPFLRKMQYQCNTAVEYKVCWVLLHKKVRETQELKNTLVLECVWANTEPEMLELLIATMGI